MKLLVALIQILLFSVVFSGDFCPSGCRCDTYDGVNTVDCSFEWLVNIESNLPQKTQVLDLSHNSIMEIGDSAFCVR